MATSELEDRIREALRGDTEHESRCEDTRPAEGTLRELANPYLARHDRDAADLEPADPDLQPVAQAIQETRDLGHQLEVALDDVRSLRRRLSRSRRWMVALLVLLAGVTAGGAYNTYLAVVRR